MYICYYLCGTSKNSMLQWKMLASIVMYHDNSQRPLVIPTDWYMGEIRKSLSPNHTSILGAVE